MGENQKKGGFILAGLVKNEPAGGVLRGADLQPTYIVAMISPDLPRGHGNEFPIPWETKGQRHRKLGARPNLI